MFAPWICSGCRKGAKRLSVRDVGLQRSYSRPSFAPKPILDLKHIRQNPGLYEQNCEDRNYKQHAGNGWKVLELHEKLVQQQAEAVKLRQRSNAVGKEIGQQQGSEEERSELLQEAKNLKHALSSYESQEKEWQHQMEKLALDLPNLSSVYTPVGEHPVVVEEIGTRPGESTEGKSHLDIGRVLDIMDFEASAMTSGWGWYFLKNEGALLEQALIQYSLSVALKRGWRVMTPPSLVYSHIANACGFMPRDQNGETQIYDISQHQQSDSTDKPSLVLAGTAEIPFAGSQANKTLQSDELPLKIIGPSRCYRAEAGARGVDTKGLYRVHEFTKVEMFAWTLPPPNSEGGDRFGSDDEHSSQADEVFAEMLEIQKEILASLGLHVKVLEMPTADLGASATRKIDIEAYFPSRLAINDGYGEVTSASICTDYQARRLGTRLKTSSSGGKLTWPYTVNGTAMAIPRILACILENHWDEERGVVHVPKVLQRYMPGAIASIGRQSDEARNPDDDSPALIGPDGLHSGYPREHLHGRPDPEDGVVRERGE